MQMTLNLAPNKHMLDLNFDENSSEQDSHNIQTKQEKPKFQKVYDLDLDTFKRDKFTSKKVQKGLFFNQDDDAFEYDNYQVQHKPEASKLFNTTKNYQQISNCLNKKQEDAATLAKTPSKVTQNILSLQFQEKSSSESQNSLDQASQLQESTTTAMKTLQSDTVIQSQKKLLDLDFSESSSDQQNAQKKSQTSSIKLKNKNTKKQHLAKKEQEKQQKNNEMPDEKISSQEENQKSESQKQKPKQKQPEPSHFKDFQFTKQPQYEVLDEIRPEQRVRAIVSRSRSGLNLLWPEYKIQIQSTKKQVLYIKKQVMLLKGEYKIYNRTQNGQTRYFGKLMANMSGTEYQIYISENGVHQNLKAEMYFPNDSKTNQPRYFIMISLIDGYNISDLIVNDPNCITLKQLYKNQQNKNKMMLLHTRKPIYHEQIRGFVLNFSGRVNMPSIKNFILQDAATQKEVLMFGKIDKENFRLQISSPLNCVLGTAVALIQFEGRFME